MAQKCRKQSNDFSKKFLLFFKWKSLKKLEKEYKKRIDKQDLPNSIFIERDFSWQSLILEYLTIFSWYVFATKKKIDVQTAFYVENKTHT